MGDREARALGSGSTIRVRDREYLLAPITMKTLHELQRESLRSYKRQYLETYIDAGSTLPDGVLERKLEEVARWDVSSLPPRKAHSVASVPITESLEKRLRTIYASYATDDFPEGTVARQAILSTALDRGDIESSEVRELTGVSPRVGYVPYDLWWVTATHEGQMVFVAASLQVNHPQMSRRDVEGWPIAKVIEAARLVETITAPDVGNT